MQAHEDWFLTERGAAVPGFLTAASAAALSCLLSAQLDRGITGNLAEIGTYMGRTFVGLVLAARPDERVVGFDLFPPEVEAGFRRALDGLAPADQAKAVGIKGDTAALSVFAWGSAVGAPLRFVHVDGGHNRGQVLHDIRLATSLLTADAVVVFDDFLHDWYPDLTEGIIDALRVTDAIVPVALLPRVGAPQGGGSKLVCAAPAGAPAYRQLLADRFAAERPAFRPLAGHPVLTFQGF